MLFVCVPGKIDAIGAGQIIGSTKLAAGAGFNLKCMFAGRAAMLAKAIAIPEHGKALLDDAAARARI